MSGARFDAVIVGAGPAGATAATLLARAGWSVAVVEKRGFPRRKVCGECVAAGNLPLLEALGLGAAIDREAGAALRRVVLMRGDAAAAADLPAAAGAHPWGRAIGREALDTLLLAQARAAGATVLQPWSAQAFEGAPGDWRIAVRPAGPRGADAAGDGAARTLRAAVAIDAHGSWEPLPAGGSDRAAAAARADMAGAAGADADTDEGDDGVPRPADHRRGEAHAAGRRPRRAADLLAFKANFRGLALADGLLPVLSFDGGYGGMVVAGDGLATVACCVRRDRLEALRRAAPGARAGEVVETFLARECAGVRAALARARREGPWLAAGPLAPGVRLRGDDAVLRLGNAAGEAHPILGEGMSMAMQSAWLLCARLLDPARDARAAAGQAAAARRYAADWRRHFAPRLALAAAFAHAAMRPAAAWPLLALARAWPGLLPAGARLGGKVRCAVDAATVAGLAAGAPASPVPDRAAHPAGVPATAQDPP